MIEPHIGDELAEWARDNLLGANRAEMFEFAYRVRKLEQEHQALQKEYHESVMSATSSSEEARATLVGSLLSGKMTIND